MMTDTDKLDDLSKAATQGKWWADGDDRDGMEWNFHIMHGTDDRVCFMANMGRDRTDETEANALLIAALVNAYRSGDLIPRAEMQAAVEAVAKAAFTQACDFVPPEKWEDLVAAIRAACANVIRAQEDTQ